MAAPAGEARALPGHATTIAGERRQVTALFYDIVGSTELLQRLDPEDFARLQRQVHGEAAAAIDNNGGHFHRPLGDGGSAYFGLPVSLEDAAECAVSAALELVARCQAIGDDAALGTALRVRVGIATGVVVISYTTHATSPGLEEVVGITPTLAFRIQCEADPNSVLVSDATYRLTRGAFEFEPLGARQLKGFTDAVPLWKAIARRPYVDRFSSSRQVSTPLIGRLDELALCRDRWARARDGRGQIVFVTGEAGIGKSRLVAELNHELRNSSCEIRVFQCQPRGNTRPLHPIIDALRRAVPGSATGSTALEPKAIREFLQREGSGVSEEAIDVIAFLSGGDGNAPSKDLITDLSGDEAKRQALNAMFEVLTAWSRRAPQLIIFEDVHWADTLTQALLAETIHRIKGLPVLVIATTRHDSPPDIAPDPDVLTIPLSRLDAEATPRLLEAIWTGPPPPGLASFIHDKSDGVPLFVEELARFLKERVADSRFDVEDWTKALRSTGVVTLQDLVSARLSGLGDARRLAQVASVIGREFTIDILSSVANAEPGGISLDEGLTRLLQAGIIQRHRSGESTVFRFRHVLLQEAAYDNLLKADRREIHCRIADLVMSRAVASPPDEIMAWHCEQAGKYHEAARYAISAAESCAVRSAVQESYGLLASAQSYLSHLDPGPELDDLTLRLLATQGPVEMALFGSGSREACQTYEKAVAICRRKGPTDRERWFPVYWGWWITSPNAEAVSRSRVIVSDLDNATDAEIKLQALHCSWATHFHAGGHHECLHCIDRGLQLYDPGRAVLYRTKYGGHDAKVCALGERGQSLWFMGDLISATASVNAALRWAEEIDHVGSICHALDNALLFNHFQKNLTEVQKLAARLRDLAERHSRPNSAAKGEIFAGWAQAMSGDVAEGALMFERGLEHQRAIGTEEDLPLYLDMRSAIFERAGKHEQALLAIDEALDHARRTSDVFWLPELHRRRAVLGTKCGRAFSSVREDLQAALSLARAQGAVTLAQRASADLARLAVGRRIHGN
jgi:predicted ATPase/class 3 adenylate cyclase